MNETEPRAPKEGAMTASSIRSVPATEPGALDGFSYTCPTCGLEITFSLESMVAADAREHAAWHRKNERARNPFDTLRENPFEDEFLRRPDGSIYGRKTR
jgi:hypothetical protein